MKKLLTVLTVITALVIIFSLNACKSEKAEKVVGISMPTKSSERWISDGNSMVEQFEALGYKCDLQYGEDVIENQVAQLENMITKGVNVLVIAGIDGKSLGKIMQAAQDNDIPFYVALPTSSIDLQMNKGMETEIENRDGSEVTHMEGWNEKSNQSEQIRIVPKSSPVTNPGFDITPARLVTGLITEKGIYPAIEKEIQSIFGAQRAEP